MFWAWFFAIPLSIGGIMWGITVFRRGRGARSVRRLSIVAIAVGGAALVTASAALGWLMTGDFD